MKWNKVENKIPSFYADVIVWEEDVKCCTIAFATENNGEFMGFKSSKNDSYFLNDITHWMAIPNADAPCDENTINP